MTKDEALAFDLALEALEIAAGNGPHDYPKYSEAITAIKQARSAPVQDEHQAFINSLPKDDGGKMFMQIDHWARESYKRHQSSVRGQMITAADSYESHVIWAALRWAKENTPPAAQRQWVGLTDEERMEIYNKPLTIASCIGAVEAKLKEKNT